MNGGEENLTLQQKEKLEKLRIYFAFLQSLLVAKTGVLPIVASLSATMLVIATFSEWLIPWSRDIKLVLSLLLALIPLSLLFAIYEIYAGLRSVHKAVLDEVGLNVFLHPETWYGKILYTAVGWFPAFATVVLSLIIVYIIIVIGSSPIPNN